MGFSFALLNEVARKCPINFSLSHEIDRGLETNGTVLYQDMRDKLKLIGQRRVALRPCVADVRLRSLELGLPFRG